nr:hypothetical protein BaRGS_028642 [Batillaria attramentaria]
MEQGLAKAYDIALQRKESGLSSRRKRFAVFIEKLSDTKVQADNPSNAELTYTVAENGQVVPATQASETLNTLQDQEVALELNRVVVTIAKPVQEVALPQEEEDKKLWIIGAVLGPALLIVVIWIVVCLVVRHSQQKKDKVQDGTSEPHLLTVKHDGDETAVTEDPESSQLTGGQSNGLLKSSPRRMTYEVNPDPDASDSKPSTLKKGKKSPKKKKDPPVANGGVEGESMEATVDENTTPAKRKTGKKSSFREPEEVEMNSLDPGFYNSQMMQSTSVHSQLYSQPTFEDEEDEFVENVEEERKRNKQRHRMRKKQQTQKEAEPQVDSAQAAYERAQKEIDKVLGPRETNAVPDVLAGNNEKKRSKRRSKKGQVNEGFTDEHDTSGTSTQPPAPAEAQETLDEVRSRVHALLDDAFSLISNSYSSIGNKVAPAVEKRERPHSGGERRESDAMASRLPPTEGMPEVEEVRGPKPGEKLHTPVSVDRTYGDYDTSGLITWSPYRASDESARIVLPETQPPATKAPVQEKLHTTTFTDLAAAGDASDVPPENHRPPTKNVGSRDERDMIADSLKPGVSPKELVDTIRQELKSMSGKLAAAEPGEVTPPVRTDAKPRKKPRKSSYIDV